MTEKELKKLNRRELLEMLIVKTAQNEQLMEENEKLKAQLEDKRISIAKCGTMAEAAIGLTKLFEEADKAVTIYMENCGLNRQGMPMEFASTLYNFSVSSEAEFASSFSHDIAVGISDAEQEILIKELYADNEE